MELKLDNMVVKPPTKANRVRNFDKQSIEQDAQDTHIIVHSRFPRLVEDFLSHKRMHGSKFEKQLYTNNFTWQNEVSRLIEKRPLMFMGASDLTMLRDGSSIADETQEWDRNGTDAQSKNRFLTLENYLSYDEIMLSSLIGVSSPSFFINDGNRYNRAIPGKPGTFQERGIIMGLVGARFERADRMDSIFMLRSKTRHQHPELTSIFHGFFGAERDESSYFDKSLYAGRMRITVEMVLQEANARAKVSQQTAYTYVIGLGLGVWEYSQEQAGIYINTFAEALSSFKFPHISTIEFGWIHVSETVQQIVREAAQKQGIKVLFSRRNPAEKLETDELLVLSYAWDGNAFPGNEFWGGSLTGSGDPAAACMSTIAELHNPLVNPSFTERIVVLGEEDKNA